MNKTVFITGATSGFGKASAEKFAANNFNVIITGRREERLIACKKELVEKHNANVLTLCFDVKNRKKVDEVINNLPDQWKQIDVLVNNAGLAAGKDFFDEANIDDWENMIDTNVKGLLYISKAILPFMKARKKGHVINIGSIAGKEVYEKGNVYCASKYAVDAISKAMRIDLLQHHIKVTSIHPGAAETEFSLVRFKGNKEDAAKTYDGYTALSAEDVANLIYMCVTLPEHVCINDLTVTCTAQANAFYTFKDK